MEISISEMKDLIITNPKYIPPTITVKSSKEGKVVMVNLLQCYGRINGVRILQPEAIAGHS